MEQVGRGVVAADAVAAGFVDRERRALPHFQGPLADLAVVRDEPRDRLLRVFHDHFGRACADDAGVTHLAAGRAVKWGDGGHDVYLVPDARALHQLAALDDGEDARAVGRRVV